MNTLYGIKNCATVKKTRKWLDENDIAYQFHDYRSDGLDTELLTKLETKIGWKNMLNRRSTSWRQLDNQQKDDLSLAKALTLMLETPTLIKRPILDTDEQMLIGFNLDDYQKLQ